MAEKLKKEKAPAKPRATTAPARKTAAKKATVGKPETAKTPSGDAIADLAYQYWKERGGQSGEDWQDWLRAERELKAK